MNKKIQRIKFKDIYTMHLYFNQTYNVSQICTLKILMTLRIHINHKTYFSSLSSNLFPGGQGTRKRIWPN